MGRSLSITGLEPIPFLSPEALKLRKSRYKKDELNLRELLASQVSKVIVA